MREFHVHGSNYQRFVVLSLARKVFKVCEDKTPFIIKESSFLCVYHIKSNKLPLKYESKSFIFHVFIGLPNHLNLKVFMQLPFLTFCVIVCIFHEVSYESYGIYVIVIREI